MLATYLKGASAAKKEPPVFVGAQFFTGSLSSSRIIPFTSLTGGIASAPSAGDLVIVSVCINNSTDRNLVIGSPGQYLEVADLYANGTNDAQLGVAYRVLPTEETSVQVNWNISTSVYVIGVYVWRGVNSVTPLDATTTTATNTSSGTVNSPSITTVTKEAVVLSIGASAGTAANYNAFTAPSGMTNFAWSLDDQTAISTTPKIQLGFASIERPTAGAYDPPAFGGGFSTTSSTMAAATLALRPA